MVTKQTYLKQASRRFGRRNPERMNVEHWLEMVRSAESAYAAAGRYFEQVALYPPKPRWCFDRFGMTRTRLPDGRIVCVAGEHEDSYDPDFCIYNDVIIIGRDGEATIFGYPETVFPPTDFHTATRVDDRLILVGSLGYGNPLVAGFTPVYTLDLTSLKIDPLETHGDAPGWIFQHYASLEPDGRTIRISGGQVARLIRGKQTIKVNDRVFRLDLADGRWTVHEGYWLEPPPPRDLAWPPGWAPMRSQQWARDVADGLSRSVGPGHPLFADDFVPIAHTGEAARTVLLRSRTDPSALIVSEGPTWCGRSDEPFKFETYPSLEAWLAAAEGRGELWWR
jgi:hypothetical protein